MTSMTSMTSMSRSPALLTVLIVTAAAACDSHYTSEPAADGGGGADAGLVTADGSGPAEGDAGVDTSVPMTDAGAVDGSTDNADAGACGVGCHVMFVTSATFPATLGGQAGADKKCQDAALGSHVAAISSRSKRFVAWISTGNQGDPGMGARLPSGAATFARVDGKLIAGSVTELLSGAIRVNIVEDESGSAIATGNLVGASWTGTAATGKTSTYTCADWTVTNGGGDIGKATDTTSTWTEGGAVACTQTKHLYCIEL